MKRIICAILAASVLASCGAAEADMPGGIMTAGVGFSTDFPGSYRVDVPPEMTADRPETAAAASSSQKPAQTDTAPVGRDGIIEKIPADDEHGEGLWLDVAVSPEHAGADYRIFNRTDGDITFGPDEDYRLTVRDGGGWLDIGFPERPMAGILLTLPAGEVYTAHVDWTDLCGELDDGTYRLIKPVNDGSSPVEIAGDFVVGISVDIVGFHSVDTVGFPKCGLDYTVTNGSGYTLTLYPDEWHIEKFDGENWARIEDLTEQSGESDAVILAPGESYDGTVDWTDRYGDIGAGEFRLYMRVSALMQNSYFDDAENTDFYLSCEWACMNPV